MKHGFLWCWHLGTVESSSEIPERFWRVVLEKVGKDQQDRSCDKYLLQRVSEGTNFVKQNKEG